MNVAVASRPQSNATTGATPQTARIAILGASGYSGLEFARLALAHPGLEIVALASREHAGHPAAAMMPGILFALVVGAFGGVFPARMAARKEILTALREV